MNIGIIVYSQTGNTLSVAQKLEQKLKNAGHIVTMTEVTSLNKQPVVDITFYDALIFGSPVHGFSVAPAMKKYLSGLALLKGKKVECFVTQQFPYPWLGGTHAIKQMKGLCENKGGSLLNTAIVNWSNKERETMITNCVERLSQI